MMRTFFMHFQNKNWLFFVWFGIQRFKNMCMRNLLVFSLDFEIAVSSCFQFSPCCLPASPSLPVFFPTQLCTGRLLAFSLAFLCSRTLRVFSLVFRFSSVALVSLHPLCHYDSPLIISIHGDIYLLYEAVAFIFPLGYFLVH